VHEACDEMRSAKERSEVNGGDANRSYFRRPNLCMEN